MVLFLNQEPHSTRMIGVLISYTATKHGPGSHLEMNQALSGQGLLSRMKPSIAIF
jgi:hypothetical protein